MTRHGCTMMLSLINQPLNILEDNMPCYFRDMSGTQQLALGDFLFSIIRIMKVIKVDIATSLSALKTSPRAKAMV